MGSDSSEVREMVAQPRGLSRHREHVTSRMEQRRNAPLPSTDIERAPKRQRLSLIQPSKSASTKCSSNVTQEASSSPTESLLPLTQPAGRTQTQAQSQSSAANLTAPGPQAATTRVTQDNDKLDPHLAPRACHLPARFREQFPEPPPPASLAEPSSHICRVLLHVFDCFQTKFNEFGITHSYRHRPSYDPDHFLTTNLLSNIVNHQAPRSTDTVPQDAPQSKPDSRCDQSPPWPWPNMSIWHLMTWKRSGSSQKLDMEVTCLVTDVLKAPDFEVKDLTDFSASKEVKRLDAALDTESSSLFQRDGWSKCSIQILVPTREKNLGGNGEPFHVPKFMHRSITSVIRAAFSESTSKWFHLTPFKHIWRSPVTGKTQEKGRKEKEKEVVYHLLAGVGRFPGTAGSRAESAINPTTKLHALGDYVGTIKMFGTTDSYSTQIGELAHCLVKKFYGSTDKKDISKQLVKQERRHTHTRRQLCRAQDPSESESDRLPTKSHHTMSHSKANTINLANLLIDHQDDPATKDFTFKLRDHLLTCLHGHEYDGDEQHFSDAEHNNLELEDIDRVVVSQRLEDNVHAHPFWYACVLRAFQISVRHVGPNSKGPSPCTMEVLWVHWLGVEPDYQWGFKNACLPKVGFVPDMDENVFSFLDPSLVFQFTCINLKAHHHRFADHDMFTHFAGIGIGHIAQFNKSLVSDIYDDVEVDLDDSEEQEEAFQIQNSGADGAVREWNDEGFSGHDADSDISDGDEDEDETMSDSGSDDDGDGEDLGFTF
ncbi:hypothetical protein BDN67DRAFT_985532 [Paxillus ammoniavirescens]|nr:hypothetical protein BDN67DRAFT_985532 [Paxillus ammoniavirescens]